MAMTGDVHGSGHRGSSGAARRRVSSLTRGRVTNVVRSRSTRTMVVVGLRRAMDEMWRALWFKPALAVFVGLACGTLLSKLGGHSPDLLSPIAFSGNANDARQVLTVLIGALIPVTSLVFALTVVTLQIASTQFSPRLLRTFLRDPGTQLVLGMLVGTIAFCLAVLYEVNTDEGAPVPRLAITCALTFAVICISALVYYFGHVTNAVRIDSIMLQVERDARRVLHRDHPDAADVDDPDGVTQLDPPSQSYGLVASRDGYLQGVDSRLARLAVRKGLTIQILPTVGYHVVHGQRVALVWSDDGSPLKATTADAILNLLDISPERRIERDLGLGLRQLVDIVDRAMSTGQNDAYTGTQAMHHITSLLLDCSRRSFATRVWRDDSGRERIVLPIMPFTTHLRVICAHTRQGGLERHPRVVHEMIRMLGIVGEAAVTAARVEAARAELDILADSAPRMIPSTADLGEVELACAAARERIQVRLDELAAAA